MEPWRRRVRRRKLVLKFEGPSLQLFECPLSGALPAPRRPMRRQADRSAGRSLSLRARLRWAARLRLKPAPFGGELSREYFE